jgi:hypothetical protein
MTGNKDYRIFKQLLSIDREYRDTPANKKRQNHRTPAATEANLRKVKFLITIQKEKALS